MTIFRTFTDTERAALKLHGLDSERPSQLSDAFVLGMRYKAPQSGYCTEGENRCNCGGDVPAIQAACSNWRGPPRGVMGTVKDKP